mmetsp:Transcript_796/g.3293  ORF Transcript_796/g.3293 Transcript_796/m.3293 type:complete len:489 (+) Transcript_796:846-2312(+)
MVDGNQPKLPALLERRRGLLLSHRFHQQPGAALARLEAPRGRRGARLLRAQGRVDPSRTQHVRFEAQGEHPGERRRPGRSHERAGRALRGLEVQAPRDAGHLRVAVHVPGHAVLRGRLRERRALRDRGGHGRFDGLADQDVARVAVLVQEADVEGGDGLDIAAVEHGRAPVLAVTQVADVLLHGAHLLLLRRVGSQRARVADVCRPRYSRQAVVKQISCDLPHRAGLRGDSPLHPTRHGPFPIQRDRAGTDHPKVGGVRLFHIYWVLHLPLIRCAARRGLLGRLVVPGVVRRVRLLVAGLEDCDPGLVDIKEEVCAAHGVEIGILCLLSAHQSPLDGAGHGLDREHVSGRRLQDLDGGTLDLPWRQAGGAHRVTTCTIAAPARGEVRRMPHGRDNTTANLREWAGRNEETAEAWADERRARRQNPKALRSPPFFLQVRGAGSKAARCGNASERVQLGRSPARTHGATCSAKARLARRQHVRVVLHGNL